VSAPVCNASAFDASAAARTAAGAVRGAKHTPAGSLNQSTKRPAVQKWYTGSMDGPGLSDFNWSMTRCNACHGVIKRIDLECYTCGEPVPGAAKSFWRRKRESEAKPAAPVTMASNMLFMASLVLTGVSFFSSQKMPFPVSAALSGILLTARIVMDRRAAPKQKSVRASSRSNEISPALLKRITLGY